MLQYVRALVLCQTRLQYTQGMHRPCCFSSILLRYINISRYLKQVLDLMNQSSTSPHQFVFSFAGVCTHSTAVKKCVFCCVKKKRRRSTCILTIPCCGLSSSKLCDRCYPSLVTICIRLQTLVPLDYEAFHHQFNFNCV